jgi:hypothetical protein
MKKTLLLALAVCSVSLAGCADDAAETDTVVVDPTTESVTPPADDMMMEDSTMMEDDMMMEGDTAAMGDDAMMEDETMADTTAGM